MSTSRRFVLNEERYVIDTLNAANSGKGYCHEGDPETDSYLRERVLMVRLSDLLEKLIINRRPTQKDCWGNEYQPFNEEARGIWWAVLCTIHASHLNSSDPVLSIEHRLGGVLSGQKQGMQDFTSLGLFRDDVECLLRDLYGDNESEALNSVLTAVINIVKEFTRYVRADLWKEHESAERVDLWFGIGLPAEGYIPNGSDFRRCMQAQDDLEVRIHDFYANPSGFSEYTAEFVKWLEQRWPGLTIASSGNHKAASLGLRVPERSRLKPAQARGAGQA